jgi:nicotinamidase-related amidase
MRLSRVDLDHAVLAVIDMQNGFTTRHTGPAVAATAATVRSWTGSGRPVVFSRYHNEPDSFFEHLLDWHEVYGPPDTDIVADLAGLAADAEAVIDKTGYTIFTPEFEDLAAREKWTAMVLCGLDTDTCVLKSAVDAFERGIVPWVLADATMCHGGRRKHEAGLRQIGRLIGAGQLIGAADVIGIGHG